MVYLDYKVIKSGIFVPRGLVSKQDMVYDMNLEIVKESCLLRGENLSQNISNPPRYLPEKIGTTIDYIDERLLFLGPYDRSHYGHWLTEGISRYWYILQHPEDHFKILSVKNLFSLRSKINSVIRPQRTHWQKGLDSFGLNSKDFFIARKPIRGREIIVPQCSVYNRYEMHHLHLSVTSSIAKHHVGSVYIDKDSTPVYLSRTKLKKSVTNYTNEKDIEDYCNRLGYKIVYPETISFREQIILFNRHDIFIGCVGSAFHSLLLRFTGRKATNIYLATGQPNRNFQLIDELMNNQSYYIHCFSAVADSKIKSNSREIVVCDTEKTIHDLSNILKELQL